MPSSRKTMGRAARNEEMVRAGQVLAEPAQGYRQGGSVILASVLFIGVLASLLAFFAMGYFFGSNNPQSVAMVQSSAPGSPLQDNMQELANKRYYSHINIVSVTSEGQGSLNQAEVEIAPGAGRVLFSINPFVEPDTQDSVKIAASVAQKYTGKSLEGKDIIVTVKNTPAKLVGGPSAGAAIAVAVIAAVEDRNVRSDAAITGTINADGSIGQIGGVIEKALAAADQNLSLFVVPRGQKNFTYYEQVREQTSRGPFTIIRTRYVPKTIDLQESLGQDGYSMRVVEAANIGEAVELLVGN